MSIAPATSTTLPRAICAGSDAPLPTFTSGPLAGSPEESSSRRPLPSATATAPTASEACPSSSGATIPAVCRYPVIPGAGFSPYARNSLPTYVAAICSSRVALPRPAITSLARNSSCARTHSGRTVQAPAACASDALPATHQTTSTARPRNRPRPDPPPNRTLATLMHLFKVLIACLVATLSAQK